MFGTQWVSLRRTHDKATEAMKSFKQFRNILKCVRETEKLLMRIGDKDTREKRAEGFRR